MKKGVIIAAVVLVSLMLAGCPGLPEPVSIEERINLFEKDLNDGKDLQGHFHPELLDYENIADEEVFKSGPLSTTNAPFNISEPVITGDVASCTFYNTASDGMMEFTMKLDGYDYKILKLMVTVGTNPPYVIERL